MKKKEIVRLVATVAKYIATMILGYLGGNAMIG